MGTDQPNYNWNWGEEREKNTPLLEKIGLIAVGIGIIGAYKISDAYRSIKSSVKRTSENGIDDLIEGAIEGFGCLSDGD